MSSDFELLQSWSADENESAFTELVHRHINLVYGSAFRQVCDSELARDVTQAVFLVLSRKAASIKRDVLLPGWLFRTTSHIAARALRTEVRRRRRENEASIMQMMGGNEASQIGSIEPEIDSALAALPPADRDALLVRFFEGHPFKSVGERLGVSEEAAKKRVSRAIERLRSILSKRGVEITSLALGSALLELKTQAAPDLFAQDVAQTVTSEAITPAVAALAEVAPETLSISGTVLATAALIALMLVTGVAFWAARPDAAPVQASTAPGPSVFPAAAERSSTPQEKPAASPGKSLLALAVRAAEDNQPIQADLHVRFGNKSEPNTFDDLRTDPNGMISLPVLGDRIDSLHVSVSAPGRVPLLLAWRGHEFVAPMLQHTVRLERGQKLEGVVQDEQGQPVEGARISFNNPGSDLAARENISFRRENSVLSDAQGHFRSDQLPVPVGDHAISYVVDHDEFVRQRIQLNGAESIRTNQIIVLKHGFKVRGRVVDEFGNPVPQAKVSEAHDYADPKKTTQADPAGEFELGPFAPGALNVAAEAEGFQELKQHVPNVENGTNLVLTLAAASGMPTDWDKAWAQRKIVRLFGKVVDAEKRQPITAFTVLLSEHRRTSLDLVGEGHNGEFDWPVQMAFFQEFSLVIKADGYVPVETDVRRVKEGGEEEFEVKLVPGSDITGQVFSQAGEPVAGAFVGLSGEGYAPMLLEGCRPYEGGMDGHTTTTDSNGRFQFQPVRGARALVVVHELGCVQATIERAAKEPLILTAWGSIEGRVIVGGRPLAAQGVTLMPAIREDSDEYSSIAAQQNVITDENGTFRFPKVPAGPITVCRYFNFNRDGTGMVGMNGYHDVEVPPGGVARVDLGGDGRTISGKLILLEPIPGYRWGDDLVSLNQPSVNEPKLLGPPRDFRDPEWRKMMIKQERFRRNQHRYFLRIQPDGTFRVDDVAPGTYTLDIIITDPPDPTKRDYENHNRKQRGKLTQTVTVENDDLNLGTIRIEIESDPQP